MAGLGRIFGICGVALAALAALGPSWCVWLWWPALSAAVVSLAYVTGRVGLLGKNRDGSRAAWAVVVLAPFLLIMRGFFFVYRRLHKEAPWVQLGPKLFLGGLADATEYPPGIEVVLDLTSEFVDPVGRGFGVNYRCVPMLDAAAPDEDAMRREVESLLRDPRAIFVHCAFGHGRSVLFAALLLLARGETRTFEEALEFIRGRRPTARLNRVQSLWTQKHAASFATLARVD